jgi:GH25 family lysozyme M1 (1,4-beta-N-acetylmuramidase)
MKAFTILCAALHTGLTLATVPGFDISHYQGSVNFAGAYSSGARFVIIKATEGTTYQDPSFSNFYAGATNAGFIRGAYHFAHPGTGTGASQGMDSLFGLCKLRNSG